MTLLDHALRWYDLGHTPLPVATDGSKRPNVATWRDWQTERPTREQIVRAFAVDHDGLGVLTGTPRDDGHQLLMIEAEGRAVTEGILNALATAMAAAGLAHLWARIIGGYVELTPSGGVHWYVLVAGDPGRNAKLASRPATAEEAASGARVQVLLETRAGGGFSVVAPSAGRSHPTGKPWLAITGTPADIPVITEAEWHALHAVARTLDQMPEPSENPGRFTSNPDAGPAGRPGPRSNSAYHDDPEVLRPGDHYIADGDWSILERHGWRVVARHGRELRWRRPGKTEGESATTGRDPDVDRLYVFSSSTPFEQDRPYDRLGVLAVLEHGGDIGAAVKALAAEGWGGPIDTSPAAQLAGLIDPATAGHHPEGATVLQFPQRPHAGATPPIDGTSAVVIDEPLATITSIELAKYGKTEDGVARALVDRCSDRLRYCPQRGLWLVWDGARWAWDESEVHRELTRQLARLLPEGDTWTRFRSKMLSAAGIAGIVRLARTDAEIAVHVDDLDSHRWHLNTPGGIIDMHTGQLAPAEREQLHTRSTTATPDYDAPAPTWERFLTDTFGGDRELIGFIQRALGVSAVGVVVEQFLPFAYGPGANGKSTLMNVITKILGRGRDGYAIALDSEALMVRKHSEHPAELAQLAGARMVVSSEIEDGHRFAEARLKQLTGGDPISARFMRGNPFTFTPTHTLWLVGNHRPATTAGGDALWRRIRLIPFEHTVPEERRDAHLEDKLMAEAPQILAWLARGAADYSERNGIAAPTSVESATADYRADQDSVGKFVGERCMKTPAGRVRAADLRAAYESFCRESGDAPVSARRLGEQLRDRHGVTLSKTGSSRTYVGVTLYADEDEPERDDWRDR